MNKCQILVQCPFLEINSPYQFEDGKCPWQEKVIQLADKIKESQGKSTEE